MTTRTRQDKPIAEWLQVLVDIEEVVSRRLAATEGPSAPADDAVRPDQTPLQTLDGRLGRMGARLEQAERDAQEADAVLQREAEAHRRWTEETATARRRLADRARGVG